jgi:DNA-binding beta-propeller fold protein YncE
MLAAAASPSGTGAQGTSEPLVLEARIPLPGVAGRIDHLAIDERHRRLLIAELGNDTVDVIDLATSQPIHRMGGLKEPQGVAYAPASDVVVVTNAGDGSVHFFNGTNFAPLGRLDLGEDADNVRVLPQTDRVVVGSGAGALTVIDPAARTKIAEIKLAAHPEGFQLSHDGHRAFVNVPDARQVTALDLNRGRSIWVESPASLRANFPLALDDADATLAVVFRSPARVMLLEAATGSVTAQTDTCGDADDVFFDGRRKRLYVSCGEGAIDVLQWAPANVHRLARVKTTAGARTALFVPALDRLFVAARAGVLSGEAAILVFRPGP